MTTRWAWLGGAGVVAVAVVVVIVAVASGGGGSTSTRPVTHTALVSRRNLVARESFDGTLGYGPSTPIDARSASTSTASTSASGRSGAASTSSASSSSGSSTVTAIAAVGQMVNQNQALFALDGDPTVLLYGATPAYRTLSTSSTPGPDILQLEYDLAAIGYNPGTVDGTYTSQTAAAVEQWETDLGRPSPDGSVELGEIVFSGGPVRIAKQDVGLGQAAQSGSPVVEVTGTARLVTVNLDASQQQLAHAGDKAVVTFADGSSVDATIYGVGTVATSASSQSSTGSGSGSSTSGSQSNSTSTAGASSSTSSATVPVVIVLPNDPKVPNLDQAPVTVSLTQQQRTGVLAVPVTSLLALTEGGYGVEVVDPSGQTRIEAVQVGVYADGYVEVSGRGITDGTKVANG